MTLSFAHIPFLKPILIFIAVIFCVVLCAVAVIYFWPLKSKALQNPTKETLSYEVATKQIADEKASEKSLQLRENCGSKLYTHGKQTERAIVMLHGYTACPSQFDALAKIFYDRGYNVYIPREPHHGIVGDSRQYSPMDAADMVQYASTSVTRGSGLGKHVGVIGLSGGGVLATWAAQYRDDVVQRALVLSPFYRPAASQVPAWQIRPLAMLYGNKILPDNFSEQPHKGFSFYGLGQYLKIVENYDTNKNLPNLQRLALVYSEGDTAIDHNLAQKIPSQLAAANPQTSYEQYAIPKTWGVGHDIVMANQPDINHHEAELFARYVELYEKSATVK